MSVRVGLAIGAERLVASIPGREAWSRPLEPQHESDAWPDLVRALVELREQLPGRRHEASIALLPRLVQLRRLELPRLSEDELRRVIARDGARYFLAREPQVVSVCAIGARRASPRAVMAAAASARVLDAIEAAARDAGWRVIGMAPAHAAWLAAARERWPRQLASAGTMECVEHGCAESMTIEAGRIVAVRRAAARSDLTTVEPHGVGAEGMGPALLAAQFASRARILAMVPERVVVAERRRAGVLARRLAAAAAVVLIASAGVEYWGAAREVRALQTQRAEIREVVRAVVETRDAIAAVESRLATLARLERSAPRWSAVIASVAEHLPVDAYLSAFRARADTLVLEGVAQEAAGVFEAMQQAPGMAAVRADAPIRQELRDGTNPVERFALAARLTSPPVVVDR